MRRENSKFNVGKKNLVRRKNGIEKLIFYTFMQSGERHVETLSQVLAESFISFPMQTAKFKDF